MTTVPAHSFSAPIRAWLIAAARVMPGVCAVFKSSWFDFTTRTPWCIHFDSTAMAAPRLDVAPSPWLPDYKLKSKRYFIQPPRALIFPEVFQRARHHVPHLRHSRKRRLGRAAARRLRRASAAFHRVVHRRGQAGSRPRAAAGRVLQPHERIVAYARPPLRRRAHRRRARVARIAWAPGNQQRPRAATGG